MDDRLTLFCYGAFFVSTFFFLRRARYSWVAAGLAALFSPLAFIVFFALLDLPLNLPVGKLGIPESVLPDKVFSTTIAFVVVAAWCLGGFLLSRRPIPTQPLNPKTDEPSSKGAEISSS